MKAPHDPRPSGDRTVGRNLVQALRLCGHDILPAPSLRTHDASGDAARQARIERLGARLAARYLAKIEAGAPAPDLWFTYHLYHKAPDWLGPAISRALSIPYVVAEASVAMKQRGGPWGPGFEASLAALSRANLVVGLNPNDAAGVAPHLSPGARMLELAPFLDPAPYRTLDGASSRARLADRLGLDAARPWLLAAAMMRADQKLASYRLLGDALARLGDENFQLLVAGDGPARAEVEAALRPLGERVRFLGVLGEEALRQTMAGSDLLVWPAVKEAFGMALLEAQATALPVVAGFTPGVAALVAEGRTGRLVPQSDPAAFARAVADLLRDPAGRRRLGASARREVFERHGLAAAAARLGPALADLRAGPAQPHQPAIHRRAS